MPRHRRVVVDTFVDERPLVSCELADALNRPADWVPICAVVPLSVDQLICGDMERLRKEVSDDDGYDGMPDLGVGVTIEQTLRSGARETSCEWLQSARA